MEPTKCTVIELTTGSFLHPWNFTWAPVPDLNVLASQDGHMLQGLITLHLVGSTLF